MGKKTIVKVGEIYNNWEVIEANIVNPQTTSKTYKNKPLFSKVKCLCCGETEKYVLNYNLKHISLKCAKCTLIERNRKNASVQIGNRYGKLTVVADGGFQTRSDGKRRHFSYCDCDCGTKHKLIMDNSLQNGNTKSCGCLLSQGEEEIKQILINNHILFQTDCTFDPLTEYSSRKLRFDFIIYNIDGTINRFIEFDGNQHKTGMWGGTWSNIEDYNTIHERDLIKNNFCLSNNYCLIRIPYSQLGKITIKDLMGNKYQVKKELNNE